MKNKRICADNVLFVLSIVAIVLVVFYGIYKSTKNNSDITSATSAESTEEDWYSLSERTIAEFQPVIIKKFNDESKLLVQSIEAEVSVTISNKAFMNWDALKKTQTLTYAGKGDFAVNLSLLGAQNIELDNDHNKVIISIPRPQLEPIEIDPDLFKADETTSGILAFGEMTFTAQEYNDLEKEVKTKLTDALDTDDNHTIADTAAVEEMTKIFEPVIQSVDNSYTVEIQFVN